MKWGLQDLVSKANQAKAVAQQAASMVSEAVTTDGFATLQETMQGGRKPKAEENIDADSLARMTRDDLTALFLKYARSAKSIEKKRKELEEALAEHVPIEAVEGDPNTELRQVTTKLEERQRVHAVELQESQHSHQEGIRQREAAAALKAAAVADFEKNKEAISKIEAKLLLVSTRTDEACKRLEEKCNARLAEQQALLEQLEGEPRVSAEDLAHAQQELSELRDRFEASLAAEAAANEAEKDATHRIENFRQAQMDLERSKARAQELENQVEQDAERKREEIAVLDSKVAASRVELEALRIETDALSMPKGLNNELQTLKDRIREQCGKNARIREHARTLDAEKAKATAELEVLASALDQSDIARVTSEEFTDKLEEAVQQTNLAVANADEMKVTCDEQIASLLRDIKCSAKQKQEQYQMVSEAFKASLTSLEAKEEQLRATQEEVVKIRSSMPSAQKVQNAQARVDDLEEAMRRVCGKIEQAEEENRVLEKDHEPPTLEATERRGVVLSVTVDDTVWVLLGEDGNSLRWWKKSQLLLDHEAIGEPIELVLRKQSILMEEEIEKRRRELADEKGRLERVESAFAAFRQTISSKLGTSVAPELNQCEKDHKRLAAEIELMEKELIQDKKRQHGIVDAERELEADIARAIAALEEKQLEVDGLRLHVQELQESVTSSQLLARDEEEEVGLGEQQVAALDEVREQLLKAREEVSAYETKISEEKIRIRRIRHIAPSPTDTGHQSVRTPSQSSEDLGRMDSRKDASEFIRSFSASTVLRLSEYQRSSQVIRKSSHCELPVQAYSLQVEAVHDDIKVLNARIAAVREHQQESSAKIIAKSAKLEDVKIQLRSQTLLDTGKETEYIRNVFRSAIETRPIVPESTPMVHVLWQFFDFEIDELLLLDKRQAARGVTPWW